MVEEKVSEVGRGLGQEEHFKLCAVEEVRR